MELYAKSAQARDRATPKNCICPRVTAWACPYWVTHLVYDLQTVLTGHIGPARECHILKRGNREGVSAGSTKVTIPSSSKLLLVTGCPWKEAAKYMHQDTVVKGVNHNT